MSRAKKEIVSQRTRLNVLEIYNTIFMNVPESILLEIFNNCLPEKIISLSKLCHAFYAVAHDESIWRKNLKLHFRDVYEANKNLVTGFFALFQQTYLERYSKLTIKQRLLFSIFKERAWGYLFKEDKQSLDVKLAENTKVSTTKKSEENATVEILFEDLLATDIKGHNLVMLVHSYMNRGIYSKEEGQKVLDLFFKSCSEYFVKNQEDRNGLKLVHWAMLCNQLTKEELFEQRLVCDVQGNTLLHIASYYCCIDTVNLLKDMIDINSRNLKGQTPFLMVLSHKHLRVLKYLFRNNADTLAVDIEGNSALHLAADYLEVKVVKWLLSKKDLRPLLALTNNEDETPLHRVLRHEDSRLLSLSHLKEKIVKPAVVEIVALFCKARANQLAQNKDAQTPLKKVIKHCCLVDMSPVVRILLANRAKIDNEVLEELGNLTAPQEKETRASIKCHHHFNLAIKELELNDAKAVHSSFLGTIFNSSPPVSKFEYYLSKSKADHLQEFEKKLQQFLLSRRFIKMAHLSILLNNPNIQSVLKAQKMYEIAKEINENPKGKRDLATVLLVRAIELFDDEGNIAMVAEANQLLSQNNDKQSVNIVTNSNDNLSLANN